MNFPSRPAFAPRFGIAGRMMFVAVLAFLPVRREVEPPYVLRAELDLQRIGQRLNEQAWPADGTASVLEQRGVIVARSRDPEKSIGQPATDALLAGIAAGRPVFRADTTDGTEAIAEAMLSHLAGMLGRDVRGHSAGIDTAGLRSKSRDEFSSRGGVVPGVLRPRAGRWAC